MLEGKVRVINRLGLHARAAAQLVKLGGSFESRIMLYKPDGTAEADAKSMLSVLALAAPRGTELVLKVDGGDEEQAFSGITKLFVFGFGED